MALWYEEWQNAVKTRTDLTNTYFVYVLTMSVAIIRVGKRESVESSLDDSYANLKKYPGTIAWVGVRKKILEWTRITEQKKSGF